MIYTHAAAALVALVVGFGAGWQAQGWRLGEDIAEIREAHAVATANAIQAARDQEQKRHAALQKEAEDAQAREEIARRDADDARDAGDRLRNELARARATACAKPSAPKGGPSTGKADDLLADVQRRLDQAADGIARFADKSYSAGIACERSADALTP